MLKKLIYQKEVERKTIIQQPQLKRTDDIDRKQILKC